MKTLIKAIGIIAVIIAAAACFPRARLRTYSMGRRWFAEFTGVKSQDMSRIVKTLGLYYPPKRDGGEGAWF